MIIQFHQGIPRECIEWLQKNVGKGNIVLTTNLKIPRHTREDTDEWFYSRREMTDAQNPHKTLYVPTIEVFDEKKAVFTSLRWE
jgi:hypothetical protein